MNESRGGRGTSLKVLRQVFCDFQFDMATIKILTQYICWLTRAASSPTYIQTHEIVYKFTELPAGRPEMQQFGFLFGFFLVISLSSHSAHCAKFVLAITHGDGCRRVSVFLVAQEDLNPVIPTKTIGSVFPCFGTGPPNAPRLSGVTAGMWSSSATSGVSALTRHSLGLNATQGPPRPPPPPLICLIFHKQRKSKNLITIKEFCGLTY